MQRQPFLTSLVGLLQPTSSEYAQAMARVVIVAGSLWFAFSGFYAAHAPDDAAVQMGRLVAVAAACVSVLILASLMLRPEDSVLRRLIGITHDCCAVSVALYLGGDTTAPFSVIYLVIILANGFRFGAPYLAYAALCSFIGFGLIHLFSPYWVANLGLTTNVMLALTVVPAYIYRLLNTLQRARVELERRATHDSLTGLMNRAGFEQQLEAFVTPRADGQVLVYFDLDRFKAVNDGAGHAAGDKLLVAVARIVRDCVRTDDICGRLGGDEFCILLQECPLPLGAQIATRLRMRIHDYALSWGGKKYSVGASVGVVSSLSIEDGPAFLRLADAACYAAKNAGRNNIHVIDATRTRVNTGEIRALHLE
ncbi:MAG: GGDEF domain-containing protein [Pseudomonadota bacterium]